MKGKALIWMCKSCRWITISDQAPHCMDFCKCKKHPTGVDHEVHYTRISGDNYLPLMLVDLDTLEYKSLKRSNTKKSQ